MIADLIGLSQSALVNYKRGRTPKPAELVKICGFFKVSPADLLFSEWAAFGAELREIREAEEKAVAGGGTLAEQQQRFDALLDKLERMEGDLAEVKVEVRRLSQLQKRGDLQQEQTLRAADELPP